MPTNRDALDFLAKLARKYSGRVTELLERRREQQARFDAGEKPAFLPQTKKVRLYNTCPKFDWCGRSSGPCYDAFLLETRSGMFGVHLVRRWIELQGKRTRHTGHCHAWCGEQQPAAA